MFQMTAGGMNSLKDMADIVRGITGPGFQDALDQITKQIEDLNSKSFALAQRESAVTEREHGLDAREAAVQTAETQAQRNVEDAAVKTAAAQAVSDRAASDAAQVAKDKGEFLTFASQQRILINADRDSAIVALADAKDKQTKADAMVAEYEAKLAQFKAIAG